MGPAGNSLTELYPINVLIGTVNTLSRGEKFMPAYLLQVLMATVAKNQKWLLLPNGVFTNLFFSYDTPPRLPRKAGSVIRRRLSIIETFKGEPLEWFIHNPLKVDYFSRVGFGHKG